MGFWDDVSNDVKGAANTVSGAFNNAANSDVGKALGGITQIPNAVWGSINNVVNPKGNQVATPTGTDPNLADTQTAQQKALDNYNKQLPQLSQNLNDINSQNTRTGLANSIQSAKENAQSRGMLSSGMEAGAEGRAKVAAGGQLAQGAQNIQQNLASTQNALQQGTIQTGLDIQGVQQNAQNTAYQQALNNYQANAAANSGMGSIAGMALAVL